MSTSGQPSSAPPRGPRTPASSAVYRRRRLVVALIALVVVIGLGFGVAAIARAFGGDGAPAADPTPTPTASPTPTVSATAGFQPEACAPGVLEIGDGASTTTFAAGAAVPFDVTLTNTGSVPCLIEAGSARLGLVIVSGQDRVWSSLDCTEEPDERELLLDVDVAAEIAASWEQVRSAPGCPEGQRTVQPGTYKALVTLDGGGSAALGWERVFTIE